MDIEKIEGFIEEGKRILNTKYSVQGTYYTCVDESTFYRWQPKVLNYLRHYLPPDNIYLNKIEKVKFYEYHDVLLGVNTLESLLEVLKEGDIILDSKNDVESLENVLYRFPKVVNKLSKGRKNVNTVLTIKDEYDVQHLLNGLLSLHFDTIFSEDAVPNSKGSCSRVAFFIKDISTILEIKMTREGLKNKELGEQLNDDISKYPKRDDCDKIYFFIYDPNNYIENPEDFEDDFTSKRDNIMIKTIIVPKL